MTDILKYITAAVLLVSFCCGNVYAEESASSNENKNGGSQTASSGTTKEYTGVYKARQIIPNTMAYYCKVSAEEILNDISKLHNCINTIVRNMNDKNASNANQAKEDYKRIRFDELEILAGEATKKGGTIAHYEETINNYDSAAAKAETEHEDSVVTASTMSMVTDVVNSMRDLYAQRLMYLAIDGIQNVDPDVIVDSAEESETGTGTSSSSGTETKTTSGSITTVTSGDGTETESTTTKDTADTIDRGTLDEVVVTNKYDYKKISDNLHKRTNKETGEVDYVDDNGNTVSYSPTNNATETQLGPVYSANSDNDEIPTWESLGSSSWLTGWGSSE